jgi:hypothetical protein
MFGDANRRAICGAQDLTYHSLRWRVTASFDQWRFSRWSCLRHLASKRYPQDAAGDAVAALWLKGTGFTRVRMARDHLDEFGAAEQCQIDFLQSMLESDGPLSSVPA